MDILDTRDLEKRRQELVDEQEVLEMTISDAEEAVAAAREYLEDFEEPENCDTAGVVAKLQEDLRDAESNLQEAKVALEDFLASDDGAELRELNDLEGEISEWRYGETLIAEEDFTEYCQQLCEDTGDIPQDLPHYIVIDWEATAKNLKMDYSSCEYQGTEYLYRS